MGSQYYKWTGKGDYTGWDYRLDVIPADGGGAYFDEENSYPLPYEVIKLKTKDNSFDKLLIGIEKIPYLEVEIDLNKLPVMSVYDDFINAVLDPLQTPVADSVANDNFVTTNYVVETGTIYKLYIKFNNEEISPVYKLVGTFIQIAGYDDEDSLKRDKITIRAEHYLKIVIDNFDTANIAEVIPEKTAGGVVEYLVDSASNSAIAHTYNYANEEYFGFILVETLRTYINDQLTSIAKVVCRSASKTVEIFLPDNTIVQYFKQTYDGTGGLGSTLNLNQIYFLATLIESDVQKGGYVSIYRSRNTLFGDYPNILDYFTNLFEESLCKAQFTETGIYVSPISNGFNLSKTLSLDMIYDEELTIRKNHCRLSSIRASLSESLGDDIDSYEIKSKYGDKDFSYSIPIVHGNLPTALEYKNDIVNTAISERMNLKIPTVITIPDAKEFTGRQTDLYYYEAGSTICEDTEKGVFVKVHKFVRYKLKTSPDVWSDDYTNCELKLMSMPGTPEALKTFMFDYQIDQNKPQIAVNSIKNIYSAQLPPIELQIRFYHYYELFTSAVESLEYSGLYSLHRISIDLSPWRAKYADLPEFWNILSMKFDFENEVVSLYIIPEIAQ